MPFLDVISKLVQNYFGKQTCFLKTTILITGSIRQNEFMFKQFKKKFKPKLEKKNNLPHKN